MLSEIDCVFNNVDGVHEDTGLMDGSHSSSCQENSGFSLSDIYNGIKFAALCGLLAFQGSPYAVAEMEFTGGIQAMSYLGDLSDLSTGFASVRITPF